MEKGFSRTVGAAGAVACAGILLASAVRLSPETRPWWDISMTLGSRGDYEVKSSGGTARTGEFSYEAMWAGTMERDGEDFLLYHIETRPLAWRIREKGQADEDARDLTEREIAARPVLRLNYILRNRDCLDFDFVVDSIPIPLAPSAEKFPLFFPCSGEHVRDRSHLLYNDFVSGGSNFVRIPLDALSANTFEDQFRWEWVRQGWLLGEAGPVFVSSRHRTVVTVSLVSHEGFRPGDESGRTRAGAAPG